MRISEPGLVARKIVFGSLVVVALGVGLVFRVAGLHTRPMHHDEANQAVKFGALLEHGDYRYDPNDHHGPTLYYLTLPVAWARGQHTLASLDERTLRLVPAIFGTGLILLVALFADGLGRAASVAGAAILAVSPAFTYYSRFYIQESLLVFFAIAFVIALGRYMSNGRWTAAVCAGACAGLAYATKETSILVLTAGAVAALSARSWTAGPDGQPLRTLPAAVRVSHLAAASAAALLVALAFYSSWFTNSSGLFESVRSLGAYVNRGMADGPHVHPWDYYLRLLSYSASDGLVWTEGFVLALALAGLAAAARTAAGFWPRYVACYTVIAAVLFSIVRYKTPWNLLPFYAGVVLLAGYGAAVIANLHRSPAVRLLAALVFVAGTCHLGLQSWRANGRYAADPRNPYVYAQTSPDFLRLVQRVRDIAALTPDGEQTLVAVVADPYEQWPLPWYLRRMTRVGYWLQPGEDIPPHDAPIVIASQENQPALDAALGDRYVYEFYGLRPDVVLALYIERPLWERFLASRR